MHEIRAGAPCLAFGTHLPGHLDCTAIEQKFLGERRFAGIPVTVLPVAVQGQQAAPQIVHAIELANRAGLFDVVIVGRGGGSLEDLWPFNEEGVARAIANSALPVVSAVGHEVDFTIADFVADVRAATPSAAAELLSPDGDDLLQAFAGYEIMLEEAVKRQLKQRSEKVNGLRARLRHPGERLQARSQALDNLEIRLQKAIQYRLNHTRQSLDAKRLRLQSKHPRERLERETLNLRRLQERLRSEITKKLTGSQQRFVAATDLLQAVSPLNTLKRGYSIVSDDEGHIVNSTKQIQVGDTLKTRMSDGELACTVEQIYG